MKTLDRRVKRLLGSFVNKAITSVKTRQKLMFRGVKFLQDNYWQHDIVLFRPTVVDLTEFIFTILTIL